MGLCEAEVRIRKIGIWTLILVLGLFIIPGILARVWSRIQSFAIGYVQFDPGRFQTIAGMVVILGVGGWILLGLLKED